MGEEPQRAGDARCAVSLDFTHKEVPSRMASTSLNTRPRESRDKRLGVSRLVARPSKNGRVDGPARRRIASNFVFLSLAEFVCRTASVVVTFTLAKRMGVDGYGRIIFAFNIVFWLVL